MKKKNWTLKWHLPVVTIIFCCTLIQLQCCKPDPEPQKYLGNYPLGEIKDYLYFQPGKRMDI